MPILAAGAVFAAAAGSLPVLAQGTAPAAANPLGIPENVTILGEADPNLRRATAKVNGHVITGTDVDQRVALIANQANTAISAEEMQRLRAQVLRNLIDETLQIQAAEFQEMPVTQQEIDQTYARVAAENLGGDIGAMDEYLRSIGSSPQSLKRQIHGELAWQNLLARNVRPFVNVAAEEVNEMIERMEAARGTEEYRLGEIYMNATRENAAEIEATMRQIMEQLRDGGSFVAYARQFSQASTAVVGGDLGFVRAGQLPPELASAAQEMQPGQLVGPIPIQGGYSILYMIDRRKVLGADPRDAVLSLKQISLDFGPGATQAAAETRLRSFTEGVQAMRGCGDADEAAAALGATVVTNDEIAIRTLPEELQPLLLQLQIGQTTPPFGSLEDGVRVLMLCGRDDPGEVGGPDAAAVMAQLEDQRVSRRAQRYLRDLRNDAFVEYN
jgi:peptidyl-prolyl cis-trans isomerase SurA